MELALFRSPSAGGLAPDRASLNSIRVYTEGDMMPLYHNEEDTDIRVFTLTKDAAALLLSSADVCLVGLAFLGILALSTVPFESTAGAARS